jgi:hypothetical protein
MDLLGHFCKKAETRTQHIRRLIEELEHGKRTHVAGQDALIARLLLLSQRNNYPKPISDKISD